MIASRRWEISYKISYVFLKITTSLEKKKADVPAVLSERRQVITAARSSISHRDHGRGFIFASDLMHTKRKYMRGIVTETWS